MKSMAMLWFIAVATLSVSFPVQAAAGELCLAPPLNPMSDARAGMIDNQDVYECPTIGQVTIPKVYEKGWRVVQMISTSPQMGGAPLIQKVILIEHL